MKYLPGFLIRFLPYFFDVFLSIPSSIPLEASFRFSLTFFLSFEKFFQGLVFKNRPGFLNPERFLLEQFMGIQQIFFPEYLPELSQCCCQSLSWTKDSHRVLLRYCCWIQLKYSLGVPVEWFSNSFSRDVFLRLIRDFSWRFPWNSSQDISKKITFRCCSQNVWDCPVGVPFWLQNFLQRISRSFSRNTSSSFRWIYSLGNSLIWVCAIPSGVTFGISPEALPRFSSRRICSKLDSPWTFLRRSLPVLLQECLSNLFIIYHGLYSYSFYGMSSGIPL